MAFENFWKFGGGDKKRPEENKKPEQHIELHIPNRLSEFPVKVVPEGTEAALKLIVERKQPFFFYLNPQSGEVLVSINKIEGMDVPISGEVTLSGETITNIDYFDPEKANAAIENARIQLKTVQEQFIPVLQMVLGAKLSKKPGWQGPHKRWLEDQAWREEQSAGQ
ncbi:MAG: hypothetical protein PHN39_00490 [Candidatus Pacebacteria bacterium]|nr:hypothetical protein [Candidatus Paceibacterota bacterium]